MRNTPAGEHTHPGSVETPSSDGKGASPSGGTRGWAGPRRTARVAALLAGIGVAAGWSPLDAQQAPDRARSTDSAVVASPLVRPARVGVLSPADSHPQQKGDATRPQAIEYSDWYGRRQTIHWYASFLTLPLFAAQYMAGEELLKNGRNAASWARNLHPALASGIGVLFALNTVTGAWNLWDSRADPSGRTLRMLHGALMIAADAGFLAVGEVEEDEGVGTGGAHDARHAHRSRAITAMSLATLSYVIMLPPFRRD